MVISVQNCWYCICIILFYQCGSQLFICPIVLLSECVLFALGLCHSLLSSDKTKSKWLGSYWHTLSTPCSLCIQILQSTKSQPMWTPPQDLHMQPSPPPPPQTHPCTSWVATNYCTKVDAWIGWVQQPRCPQGTSVAFFTFTKYYNANWSVPDM